MSDALTIDRVTALVESQGEPYPAFLPRVIDPRTAFLPVPMAMIEEAAELISTCPGLAVQFEDPKNCRFVAYQAARWGADPIAVASKTYFSPRKGGGLLVGYEAQLIMALVNSDPDLVEPLDFQYGYSDANRKTANFRFCKAIGFLRGIARPRTVTSPTVGQIKVKNSPLWFSDVDQQLAYYTGRTWARRHRPHRLLGIYAPDELQSLAATDDDAPRRPLFEEDGADFGDGIPFVEGDGDDSKGGGRRGDDRPPAGDDQHQPKGLEEARAWASAEQTRILAMDFPPDIEAAWNAMVKHEMARRLVAYEPATMNAIKATIAAKLKPAATKEGESGK